MTSVISRFFNSDVQFLVQESGYEGKNINRVPLVF